MMNQPPVDKMAKMMDNNKYKLCCVMEKRAKEIEKRTPELMEQTGKKSISLACEEILAGKVIADDTNLD